MTKNKTIVLLSGGLDSVVSLASIKKDCDDILALTFNYNQKSLDKEINASQKISEYYKVEHKIIDINWLGDISKSAINTNNEIPLLNSSDLDDYNKTKESANSVWVANRNGLFVNIAACYADAMNYDYIVIGANKEEGKTFKDNSASFIEAVNNSLKNSCNYPVMVKAPLLNMTKEEIVKLGISMEIPFEFIQSCYQGSKKHCGICESCKRLKRALELNKQYNIIEKLFD